MFEPWVIEVSKTLLTALVTWGFGVAAWRSLANIRESWRQIRASHAELRGTTYQPPSTPASRPPLRLYMQALTVLAGGCAALAVVNVLDGRWWGALSLAAVTCRAALDLRKEIHTMRSHAADSPATF